MRVLPLIRSALLPLVLVGLSSLPLAAQVPLASLRPALESRIERHRGTVAVALLDPRTGESLSIRGDQPFPAASLVKVPVLVELFHQVEKGELRLDDPIYMLEVDKQPGSGVLRFFDAPLELTVRDAATFMIAVSDNTATNLLLDKLGIRSVWERMEALGLPRTKLHSKTFLRSTSVSPDSSARYGLGVTTANEYARLLAMIHRGEVVSAAASQQMVDMLKKQFYANGLPRGLAGASVAHKTGDLEESRHDCGIIYSPARDYVLCVLTGDNADTSWTVDNEAHLLIADLARLVHQRLAATTE